MFYPNAANPPSFKYPKDHLFRILGLSQPNAWRIQIATTSRGTPCSSSRRTVNPAISPLDGTQPWKPTPATSSITTHGKLPSLFTTGVRVTSQPRATRGCLSSTPRAKWSPSFTPECPEDSPATSLPPLLFTSSSIRSNFTYPKADFAHLEF